MSDVDFSILVCTVTPGDLLLYVDGIECGRMISACAWKGF